MSLQQVGGIFMQDITKNYDSTKNACMWGILLRQEKNGVGFPE